jgi:hypothetical protein
MGLGGLAAVAAAVGALALPASAQAILVPAAGGSDSYAPMTSPAKPAMTATDDPGNATLTEQLAAARLATAKYATNLDQAREDGYQIITMMMPNMGFHFMNPNVQGFNVRKPQILVYEHGGGKWQLGALEWVFPKMPQTPPLPNATFGSFPAACHYKDGTFIPDENSATCPKKASTGATFTFWHPDLVTMHVWIWYPNPAGLFSSTNPLVAPFNGG